MCEIDRCIAKAIYTSSLFRMPPLFIGKGALQGCCAGGMSWLGFTGMAPFIKYFVSTGSKDFRNGEAEHLKSTPDMVVLSRENAGKITPPGQYLVISACEDIEEDPGVRSILCFGNSEQIRNLGGLVHYDSPDIFNAVLAPWGPTCATFVTYPAGMAEKAPKDSSYIGPMDPTGNVWFPEGQMAIGIPVNVARRMSEGLEGSFLTRRRSVAFPENREKIQAPKQ